MHAVMRKRLLFLLMGFLFIFPSFAQTGPGEIGNATGSNGHPKIILWIRADDLSLSDGASVSAWADSSGNGNDLGSSANDPNDPAFYSNQINGLPVVRFNSSTGTGTKLIRNPFNSFSGNEITTIVVYKTSDSGDGLISYATSNDNNEYLLYDNSNLRVYTGGNYKISSQAYNTANFTILSQKWRNSDNAIHLFKDGTNNYNSTLGAGNVIDNGGCLSIGGEQDAVDGSYQNSQAFDGDIAEIIMFDNYLNDAQRTIIENYLNVKYGITIGNDVFASGAATYTYDVTGIGQEADGNWTTTVCKGVYLVNNGALDNGDYVMIAHDNSSNSVSTADLPTGVVARWAKDWYIEQTGSQNVTIKFDLPEGISGGQYPQIVSNYVLLYRSTTTGTYDTTSVPFSVKLGDADQVAFDITGANLANGYYTLGTKDETNSPVEGTAGVTWYTLASGNWNDWQIWTLDPSGALPNNPDHLYPNLPSDKAVIKSGKTVTMNLNNIHISAVDVDGRLDLASTTGHTFDNISGSGRILLSSDNFPSYTDASYFVDADKDHGTVVYYGNSSYNLANAQTFYNMEVNMDVGQTLTLLNDLTLNGDLNVTQGTFQINDNSATTNLNITVYGDVTVASAGLIHTGSANARHQFNMYGDFTNNGEVKFTNRTAADYANEATDGIVDANFLNASKDQTILCNGTTNFYRIEIDKGTDDTYILDIQATASANFNLFGYAAESHGSVSQLTANNNALGLIKGTVKIGSNVNIPVLSTGSNYNVSAAARLWVAGGTVQKNSGNSLVPYGTIEVSAGLLEAKVSSGITTRENGLIRISGGTINTNVIRTSVLGSSNVGGYVQSGGTVNVVNAAGSTPDYYHFCLTYPGNVFNMSGGTLHVYDTKLQNGNEGGIFIASDASNINVTGGTVIAEISAETDTFKITSTAPFYNLILRNTLDNTTDFKLAKGENVGSTDENLAAQPLVVLNDLTIEQNVMLHHNSQDITIGGDLSISRDAQLEGNNRGIYYTSTQVNTLTFNGSGNSSFYIGYNTADALGWEFYCHNLEIAKENVSDTITISSDTEKDISGYQNRILHVIDTIWVRKGVINQGRQSVRLFGEVFVYNGGQMGIYEAGTTKLDAYFMLRDGDVVVNTEQGAIFGNIKLNTTGTVTLTSDVYMQRIGYYIGLMNLKTYNLKVDYLHSKATSNNYDATTEGSTTEMIYSDANASDGGISLKITGNGTYSFPLGTKTTTTRYTWAQVTVTNFVDSGYITINPVDGELKTTNLGGGDLLSYYWRVRYSDFSNLPTVSYQFKYSSSDIVGTESGYFPGKVLDVNPFTRSYEAQSNMDYTNNIITFDDTGGTSGNTGNGFTLEKANYTAGQSARFTGTVALFHSNATYTNWNSGSTWLEGSVPTTGSVVYIRHRDRIWGNSIPNVPAAVIFERTSTDDPTSETIPRLQFNTGGTFDIGVVSGTGMISLNTNANPTVTADWGEFANNDTSIFMYWGSTGGITLNNIPQPLPSLMLESDVFTIDQNLKINDDLIFNGNADATFVQDIEIGRDLVTGFWRGGTFHFPGTGNAITVTVGRNIDYTQYDDQGDSRNIVVDDPGSASTLEHTLIVKGDIIQGSKNNYTFDLYNAANRPNVILELQGDTSSRYYRTSTVVPDLYRIVMNKGTSQTDTFSFNNSITVSGATSGVGVKKAIELKNGVLRFNDPAINVALTTGDDDFEIPSSACLQITQGQATASGNSGIILDGKILIDGGTLDMSGGDNFIQYSASGSATIDISSGSLIVGSQIRRGTASTEGILTYNQSGGTVEIGKSAAGTVSRGIFEILNTGSSFTLSGGTFSIANDYRINPTKQSIIFNPETVNMSSGTAIQIGNANTAAGKGNFTLYAGKPIKNLITDNSSGNTPKVTLEVVPLTVEENLTIGNGTEFDANGIDLYLNGNFTNNGTFTANSNNTIFNGSANQTITGVTTFYDLTDSCTATLNLANDITVSHDLNLRNGTLEHAGNVLHAQGNIFADDGFTTTSSAVCDGISLEGTSQQEITGSITFSYLTSNNPNGVTIPTGYTTTINKALNMKKGVINIGKNLLVIEKNASINEVNPFSSSNMVQTNISFTDAGIKKYFPTISSSTNFTYPIGSNGKYTPVSFTITNSATDNMPIRVKAADEIHPTIINDAEAPDPEIPDTANVLKYYWILDATGASSFTADVTMQAVESDIQVTSPYDSSYYITARLLDRNSGLFDKYTVYDFNGATSELYFSFNNTDDNGIDGDYLAGVDSSGFNGAIPDQVPLYISNQDGNWTDQNIWTPTSPAGGPKGARVIVRHNVTIPQNYIVSYETWIDNTGKLLVNNTFGHRLGNTHGTGTLYLERGDMPAANYEGFFAADSGTIEFGGTTDYDILSEIPEINNMVLSGSGQRRLPNLDLQMLGNLTINGPELKNEQDKSLAIKKNITFTAGTFTDFTNGTSKIELNGNSTQTIGGSVNFDTGNSSSINNLKMNNPSGVNLNIGMDINNQLDLTSGKIVTTTTNKLTILNTDNTSNPVINAGTNSFVDGPLYKKINNSDYFEFPVGDGSRYGKVKISNVSTSGSQIWMAQYFNHDATTDGYDVSVYDATLQGVFSDGYWNILAPAASTADVRIRWDGGSNAPADAADRAKLRVAEWLSSSTWTEAGNTVTDNGQSDGYIETSGGISFNELANGDVFAIGSDIVPQTKTWVGNTTDWADANNWSPTGVPTSFDQVTIPTSPTGGNFPVITTTAQAKDLTIDANALVTINPTYSLVVENQFNVASGATVLVKADASGSASLITNGTITNNGTCSMELYLTNGIYHYISMPNAVTPSSTFETLGGYTNPNWYYYDEVTGYNDWNYAWLRPSGTLNVAQGYALALDRDMTYTLNGTFNSGNQSITITNSGSKQSNSWNLIGNPYPSAISIDDVINANNSVFTGTVYLWDDDKSGGSDYTSSDYATYTLSGATSGGGGKTPNGYIAPGQAFIVQSTVASGSFTFDNSMRRTNTATFFKKNIQDSIGRIRLYMVNSANDYNEMLLSFHNGVTQNYDLYYDGKKIEGNSKISFYSLLNDEKMAIQALPKIDENMDISLGFNVGNNNAGTHTIYVKEIANLYDDIQIYLKDNELDSLIDLRKTTSYTFTAPAGRNNSRFELICQVPEISETVWQGGIAGNWHDASNWSNGVPSAYKNAIIANGSAIAGNDVVFRNLTIEPNAAVEFAAGIDIDQHGTIQLKANENGVASLANKGAMGIKDVEIETFMAKPHTNYYIASPIKHTKAYFFGNRDQLAGTDFDVRSLKQFNNNWESITDANQEIEPLKALEYKFSEQNKLTINNKGYLNSNTEYQTSISTTGFVAIGNPYSAYIDWSNKDAWTGTENVEAGIYVQAGKDDANYATYNRLSGIATNGGSATIAPTKAFFVYAKNSGNLGVKQIAQSALNKSVETNSDNYGFRFTFSMGEYSDEFVLFQNTSASKDLDDYDTRKLFSSDEKYPQIYSYIGKTAIAANGITEITQNMKVELNFKAAESGDYHLTMEEFGYPTIADAEWKVYLVDNLNADTTEISSAGIDLHFDGQPNEGRFELIFKTSGTGITTKADFLNVFSYNKRIIVQNPLNRRGTIRIYSLDGKEVANRTTTGGNEYFEIQQTGIYLLKFTDKENNIYSYKLNIK